MQSVTGRRKTVSHETGKRVNNLPTLEGLTIVILGTKLASGKENKLTATITFDASTLPEKEDREISIGSYVIVKYQKKYFPGIVVNIEENEYEVKTMTPLIGSDLFKWPNPKDQIWYKKNQIMEEIAAPILKKLGCFECQEISKYN